MPLTLFTIICTLPLFGAMNEYQTVSSSPSTLGSLGSSLAQLLLPAVGPTWPLVGLPMFTAWHIKSLAGAATKLPLSDTWMLNVPKSPKTSTPSNWM